MWCTSLGILLSVRLRLGEGEGRRGSTFPCSAAPSSHPTSRMARMATVAVESIPWLWLFVTASEAAPPLSCCVSCQTCRPSWPLVSCCTVYSSAASCLRAASSRGLGERIEKTADAPFRLLKHVRTLHCGDRGPKIINSTSIADVSRKNGFSCCGLRPQGTVPPQTLCR